MLNQALLHPKSIVVVGASNTLSKPGGHLLQNLLVHPFTGDLYVVNPREDRIQGIEAFASVDELPAVDLAILAIPAAACVDAVEVLARDKGARGFVVISAGFSESGVEGRELETRLLSLVNLYQASLIGPNCIGLISATYAGVFTSPVPALDPQGIDFISGSGATAVFILESGMAKGLRFASVFSVGNSTQIGVEEVLEHFDQTFDPQQSSRVKLLYLESIRNPQKLLKHAGSLIQKGCRIAAIKAGVGDSGARAALSHTGALASSDLAVDALFRKAGVIRCYGREELTTMGGLLLSKEMAGTNFAVITHAGGPAVMLTDTLEKGGFKVPRILDSEKKSKLKAKLFLGASVENPIDFLATGTADQLSEIIDAGENDFSEIDAMVVIFGSPGLGAVDRVYQVLKAKMKSCRKPIYAVLPSVVNAEAEMREFIASGQVCFPDEVELGKALIRLREQSVPKIATHEAFPIDQEAVRAIMSNAPDGFLEPAIAGELLKAAGIPVVADCVAHSENEALQAARQLGFPLVMKVVGPLHKSDVDGVVLDINTFDEVVVHFRRLMNVPGTHAILLAQMVSGMELYIGVKKEIGFGHLVLCGLGGVWLEAIRDIQCSLAPLSVEEAEQMITKLSAYPILAGFRGKAGIDLAGFVALLCRVSHLLQLAPEICEMDLNPILAQATSFQAVDIRIRIANQVSK
ncbi:acetate--CoA ligase family protein [Mangrovibacterium sp.]|uniref:acetate--CoA ligase family protein n=1 Tax=Mangrovibacterium sp. TaxID=1961364 RepID=UPI00356AA586